MGATTVNIAQSLKTLLVGAAADQLGLAMERIRYVGSS